MTLSESWVLACMRLWHLCKKHDIHVDDVTIWDGFKFLYLDSIPPDRRGRKALNDTN